MDNRIIHTKVKCPKCKSLNVALNESFDAFITHYQDKDGNINLDNGIKEFGDIIGVKGMCQDCYHEWKVRKCSEITQLDKN